MERARETQPEAHRVPVPHISEEKVRVMVCVVAALALDRIRETASLASQALNLPAAQLQRPVFMPTIIPELNGPWSVDGQAAGAVHGFLAAPSNDRVRQIVDGALSLRADKLREGGNERKEAYMAAYIAKCLTALDSDTRAL